MTSSGRLSDTNAIEQKGRQLDALLQSPALQQYLETTHVNWDTGETAELPREVQLALDSVGGLAKGGRVLTPRGSRLLSRLQFDLEGLAREHPDIATRFRIEEALAHGGNSVALKATNLRVGRTVVLKLLYPQPTIDAESAIAQLGKLENIPHLVAPVDSYSLGVRSIAGDQARLHCIVFPFVPARTLKDYLSGGPPVSPYFFEAFIRQVGGVLDHLQAQGTGHGDLHAGNILVTGEDPGLDFTVIDLSGGLGSASRGQGRATDFDWFKEHLATALALLRRHLPSVSVQKYFGPKLLSTMNTILGSPSMTFAAVLRSLDADPKYKRWLIDRASFISKHFETPRPLGLLRWEEIADPAKAVDLFEPYEELFRRVRTFGNTQLVGARGSGKSTYLAALAYFPGASRRLVEPSEAFGVLFSCRQGEFKQFSHDFLAFDTEGKIAVKHVLVLKIIRRLLSTLSAGLELGELVSNSDMGALHGFLRPYLDDEATLARLTATPAASLANLVAGVVRWEEMDVSKLFVRSTHRGQRRAALLDEGALLKFCSLVRSTFPALATTQFYFLFDDAGSPNLPSETQHLLNDLVTSSNAVYCVKISAERFSYDLSDSAGRTLEEAHDITYLDISSSFSTDSGRDTSRRATKEYFAGLMRRRLKHWNYPSHDITAYLGDQMKPGGEAIPIRTIIERLAAGQKNAYYCGWDVVWQLADKTARSLIDLVSEIFAHAKVLPPPPHSRNTPSPPEVIAARVQDRAIRFVSKRRLRALEFTPGEITLRKETVALGKHLYLCASSFGAVSHRYLTTPPKAGKRHDERLGIERNDTRPLNGDATKVLQLLVRYGIFDDSSLNVARDDRQQKPIYVFNRIFCPAFGISFRRDAHVRVSVGKLSMFLIDPARFLKDGTAFLRGSSGGDQRSIFE